jgi:hypothetical protein
VKRTSRQVSALELGVQILWGAQWIENLLKIVYIKKVKRISYPKTILAVLILGIILLPIFVSAQEPFIPCGNPGQPACEFCHLFVMFSKIVNFILNVIVPPIAILMLIIGGLLFYFSAGDPTKAKQATGILKATIVGMLIVYFSWSIVVAIFDIIGVINRDSWLWWSNVSC